MRRILFIVICYLALAIPLAAQNKAALIGISEYQPGSGWHTINAHNDIELIKSKLSPSWQVFILENESATHLGIIQLFEEIETASSPSDTVLIHFSCHGQQMIPIINSEDEPDMLDEALVPYDAFKKWSPSYDGRNHLRDDELSKYINRIRDKVGASGMVIVTLDACHSDSMNKEGGNAVILDTICRGTSDIFGDSCIITDAIIKKRYVRDTSLITISNNSPVLYLSACQAHSQNAEIVLPDGIGYGSLSYSIACALDNASFANITEFLNNVVVFMDSLVPYQTPGIRASFNYTKPDLKPEPIKATNTNEENHDGLNRNFIYILIAALALLVIIIWSIKKK